MRFFHAKKKTGLVTGCLGQAVVDYVLVLAVLALALAGVSLAWKGPLAHYLQSLAQAISKIR